MSTTNNTFGVAFYLKKQKTTQAGCFGDMLHPVPWQTDHLFCWQRNAAHALAA